MSEALREKVYRAVSDVFGVPIGDIHDGLGADDLAAWDSFNVINLLMVLESETGASLSAEDATGMVSVKHVLELLEERGAG